MDTTSALLSTNPLFPIPDYSIACSVVVPPPQRAPRSHFPYLPFPSSTSHQKRLKRRFAYYGMGACEAINGQILPLPRSSNRRFARNFSMTCSVISMGNRVGIRFAGYGMGADEGYLSLLLSVNRGFDLDPWDLSVLGERRVWLRETTRLKSVWERMRDTACYDLGLMLYSHL